jgi:predicted PurR-regulated permease PerM
MTITPQPSLRTTALSAMVVLLVVLAFAALLSLRNVIVSIFLGLLLATALRPLMSRLREGRVPRLLAASASILALILAIVGFLVLVVPMVVAQSQGVIDSLPGLYDSLRMKMASSGVPLLRMLGARLADDLPFTGMIGDASLAEQALTLLPTAGYTFFVTVGTLLFTYYWLLYRERSLRGLLLLLPIERRERAEELWLQIEDRIGAFVRGQTLLALVTGVFSLVAYLVIGLPYAPLMALIGGVLEFVPFLGPFIATGVAVVIGLSVSPSLGVSALVAGIIIQQIENIFLAPRIMDRAVGISPVVTLLAFVGFAALFGPVGGLLAIPMAAMLQVLFRAWVDGKGAPVEEATAGRGLADRVRYEVRDLARDLSTHLREKEDVVSADADASEDAIEQVIADLQALLGEGWDGTPSQDNHVYS